MWTLEARAEDVNGAAKAFSQGQQAVLDGDPARAAEMFELADELAPSAAALRNAVRARLAAGHAATAATLAAQLLQRYTNDKESRAVADAVLSDLAPKLTQVEITCSEDCTITLDGRAASSSKPRRTHVLYVQPGARTIGAAFGERQTKEQLTALPGGSHKIELKAPPAPAVRVASPPPVDSVPTRQTEPRARGGGGIGRKWVLIGGIATVALGGVATWQGMQTLDTRDEIKAATAMGDAVRANTLYDRGRDEQLRTNILLGATAVVGAGTIVLAILADWSPEEQAPIAVTPSTNGAAVTWRGRF